MSHRQLNAYENIVWESTPSQWVNFGFYAKTILWLVVWTAGLITAYLNEGAIIDLVHTIPALQASNLQPLPFATGMFGGVVLISLALAVWNYLKIKTTRFVLTTQRLFTHTGVLNRQLDELELYRVKDYSQFTPFLMRLVGLGCVSVETSDRSHPVVNINGIKDPDFLQGLLRQHCELCRNERGVRELDM